MNKIKGFFIPGSDHVVGTIMSIANDLAGQPKAPRDFGVFPHDRPG